MGAFDWNIPIGIGTAGGFALAGGGALYSWMRSRRTTNESDKKRLERIELLLAGKPADPETNMPAMPGFVGEMRQFRKNIESELRTNSGSSLKDHVQKMSLTLERVGQDVAACNTELGNVKSQVEALQGQVDQLPQRGDS